MDQNKIWESFNLKTEKQNPRCLAVNTVLAGKYLVGPVLGEGGFGITYAGYDLNMETRIAIKEYFPVELVTRDTTRRTVGKDGTASGGQVSESASTSGGGSDRVISLSGEKSKTYQQGLKKYVDEARNVSQFADIPGIVSVKDFFYENDTAYIVMEYIEGVSLKEYLKQKGGKVSEEEALAILRPVLEALEKVHAAGIVHRDISPDNIMLTFTEKEKAEQASASDTASTSASTAVYGNISAVKLIDFGAARMTSKNDQKSLTIILKHGYAPEEQYRSHGEQGPWTDVYALCAVLYRMLTGKVPEPAMDRLFSDGLKSPEELGVKVSPAVSEAIMRGLAVKKEERIQSVRELMDALYAGKKLKKSRGRRTGGKSIRVCCGCIRRRSLCPGSYRDWLENAVRPGSGGRIRSNGHVGNSRAGRWRRGSFSHGKGRFFRNSGCRGKIGSSGNGVRRRRCSGGDGRSGDSRFRRGTGRTDCFLQAAGQHEYLVSYADLQVGRNGGGQRGQWRWSVRSAGLDKYCFGKGR